MWAPPPGGDTMTGHGYRPPTPVGRVRQGQGGKDRYGHWPTRPCRGYARTARMRLRRATRAVWHGCRVHRHEPIGAVPDLVPAAPGARPEAGRALPVRGSGVALWAEPAWWTANAPVGRFANPRAVFALPNPVSCIASADTCRAATVLHRSRADTLIAEAPDA